MKGIILAGGSGSRLGPLTRSTSKQLLPVFDKPMIYYPLSVLMLAGIRDIAIITTPRDRDAFITLLGDGSKYGVSLDYVTQDQPRGISEAFILCADFIGDQPVTLILGDNLFYGHGMSGLVRESIAPPISGATVFSCSVSDPSRYGVATIDGEGRVIRIEEKPANPTSNLAITGLYIYDNTVVERARSLSPSARGELEITDLNRTYLEQGTLKVTPLGRGVAWMDTGTPDALLESSEFVRSLQRRQGLHIACLEEIAFRQGWITQAVLAEAVAGLGASEYGRYLAEISDAGR